MRMLARFLTLLLFLTSLSATGTEMCIRDRYMNEAQLAHFKRILEAWRNQLRDEVDRTVSHMQDEAANFPVSYTHLDVYKRQIWRNAIPPGYWSRPATAPSTTSRSRRACAKRRNRSVSYTHLEKMN